MVSNIRWIGVSESITETTVGNSVAVGHGMGDSMVSSYSKSVVSSKMSNSVVSSKMTNCMVSSQVSNSMVSKTGMC